jgi:starch phosphorylase
MGAHDEGGAVPGPAAIGSVNDGQRDIELRIAELTDRLPAELAPLARLAYNYRWAWMPGAAALFREISPALWRQSRCDPRAVLELAAPRRLRQLASEPAYTERLRRTSALLDACLDPAPDAGARAEHPVAYFCAEFGIHCSLPIYGGGLGVLAGDLLKAAADLAVPLIGVGIFYRQGYFHQRLDQSGWQTEYPADTAPERLPAALVTGPDERPLTVELAICGRTVRVQIWRIGVGSVALYLLDTDRDDNHPIDRWTTSRLYVGDRRTRLAQYAVLGIGGARALEAMGIQPGIVHLNEGHAALGSLERMQRLIAAGRDVDGALAEIRHHTVFTTHTPVAAGNEWYDRAEVEPVLSELIERSGVPREFLYALGGDGSGTGQAFGLTPLALRTSRATNGVSRRHGEVARAMWQGLWKGRSVTDVPIGHVTNGVHTQSWMASPMQELMDRHLGPGWREREADDAVWAAIADIPDEELWTVRGRLRRELVEYVRHQSVVDRLSRGEPPDYVEAAAKTFDPDTLTVGFARRVAAYKRLYLLTRFPRRALSLVRNETRRVQTVIAGKAHPRDDAAKQSLQALFTLKRESGVGRHVVFLEDYDLHMAPRIVAGIDLWLNLPRAPLEASGTSGMKVTLNGGLNLSVLDGWWAEAYDGQNGWGIESPEADPESQDDHDARALFDLLETEILPLFYERDANGVPRSWVQRIKHAMRTLIPRFTAARMMQDYQDTMYAEPRE